MAEVAERCVRRHNYRLGQARFPSVKELDAFEFSGTPLNAAILVIAAWYEIPVRQFSGSFHCSVGQPVRMISGIIAPA
jgi:hypothetical protein